MTPRANPIAAFPKCYMDQLCVERSMSIFEWIEQAATLGVDGLEMYPGFFTSLDRAYLAEVRGALRRHNLAMPMLCASPDFTRPDPGERQAEIERLERMIDLVAFFNEPTSGSNLAGTDLPRTCRVLSGQRRPKMSEDDGVAMVTACIEALLPYAAERGVVLALENHYKDNYWTYPEFAQHLRVFRRIVEAIDSPHFGVNYDPSNAVLAGEDPLEVLEAVKGRVVSMHASDRGLAPGHTLEELRAQEESAGYAAILRHGEVGTGLIDYPTTLRTLRDAGFGGWISIEDGVNGLDEIRRSADYLRATLAGLPS